MATQNTSGISGTETNSLDALMDVVKPQISNIAFAKQGYLLPANIFKTMGMLRPIAGEVSYHFEIGNAHPNFQTSTTVTGAAGADITITVSAASSFDGKVYPRVTDTVRFKNRTAGKVITKTQNGTTYDLVIRPFDVTGVLATTSGDFLWILGNAQPEGGSDVEPRVTKKTKVGFPVQIIREDFKPTGSALTNEWWINRDQNGNARNTYASGVFDTEFRYWEQWGNILLFNPLNTNTSGITEATTYSLEYLVTSSGLDLPYASGSFGITEFSELIRYYNKNKGAAGNKFLGLVGPEFNLSMNKGISDVFSQNPIVFAGQGTSAWADKFTQGVETEMKENAVDINFRIINYSGMTFYNSQVEQLGLNTTGGATGFKESEYGFFIPLTKGVNQSSDVKDRMTINYKKYDRWDRMVSVKEFGRNAMVATSPEDTLTVDYLGHFGLETWGLEGFALCRPSN
jgi:hypothetical protein